MPYFDIKRDNELIGVGSHFWCDGCLVARPLDDISVDARYCQGCFKGLKDEASLLSPSRGKPGWVPVSLVLGRAVALPAVEEVVAKLPHKGILPVGIPEGVLQHAGGRPKKAGEVHRTTKWRRKKETQGVMML